MAFLFQIAKIIKFLPFKYQSIRSHSNKKQCNCKGRPITSVLTKKDGRTIINLNYARAPMHSHSGRWSERAIKNCNGPGDLLPQLFCTLHTAHHTPKKHAINVRHAVFLENWPQAPTLFTFKFGARAATSVF